MANKVLGMHRLKNKVTRNAFDLSHRHMFTAQVGELLPIFTQWVNPNETFKIGYNGKTRTAALNTDAFTRIRENVQYYFVPFQSLWKYFEQQVNNMTKGDSGQNISKFASSSTEASLISTSMPYISYVDLASWLSVMLNRLYVAVNEYFLAYPTVGERSVKGFYDYCLVGYPDVFVQEGYRLCRASKLLMALGYGNFSASIQYDVYVMAEGFVGAGNSWSLAEFKKSDYALDLSKFEANSIINSPNLSLFPLLAYHKICNDHYRNEKWQPFEPWTCNIDYLSPSSNMNAGNFISRTTFEKLMTSIIDLENSNLPVDYFTSVLPRAQYGDEGAAVLNLGSASGSARINGETHQPTYTENYSSAVKSNGTLATDYSARTTSQGFFFQGNEAVRLESPHNHKFVAAASIDTSLSGTLKISALRSATALQKYKEIQNSNDPDFASQVIANFMISQQRKE